MIDSYNKTQRDTPLLHIYLIKYCTSFGQVHCPSSGVSQPCIHAVVICRASSVGCQAADANRTNTTDTYCCLHSVEILLMMDSEPVRNMYSKTAKSVPLQAWRGPQGSRKLRFPDFVTAAQDGGKVVSLTHRPPLPPRKYSWYSFLLEGESTPGP